MRLFSRSNNLPPLPLCVSNHIIPCVFTYVNSYELPVQYEGLGVMAEHNWTRGDGQASLFDVSHMGQVMNDIIHHIHALIPLTNHFHTTFTHCPMH